MTAPSTYPGTETLVNRLGLRDADLLAEAEGRIAAARDLGLVRAPEPGSYDLGHLRRIHRRLFGDVYEWAGELRTVDISKGLPFAHWEFIVGQAERIFRELEDEDWLRDRGRSEFVNRLTHYLGEVNALHPFREGNGRAQRAFFRQLSAESGWHLDWAALSPDENDQASLLSLAGDDSLLQEMLERIVAPLKD